MWCTTGFHQRFDEAIDDTSGGLVKDATNVWIIHCDRTRNWLSKPSDAARTRATLISNIGDYSKRHGGTGDYNLDATNSATASMMPAYKETSAQAKADMKILTNDGWCSGSISEFKAVPGILSFDVTGTECRTLCAEDVNCDAVNYAPSLPWKHGQTNFCKMYGAQIENHVGWTTSVGTTEQNLETWPDTGIVTFPTKYKLTCATKVPTKFPSQVPACADLGSVADTCKLHLKHVDSAIKKVDTNTNYDYACAGLGSTISAVTLRKASADGAYTDGQKRVAHNIASKNLFTKCFLTKVALDECNGELETTYSKEFSKGKAGVVQESAETEADDGYAEAMTKATGKATTARGLCTDLYNQREAHIDNDRTILHKLKPLLQQLNICDGKDGDATDTKRNMFGDNLLQVAASSTSEMQAKCALVKKSVSALLETRGK